MSEYCVCCGEEIPEGRMVCPLCAAKAERDENEKPYVPNTKDEHCPLTQN